MNVSAHGQDKGREEARSFSAILQVGIMLYALSIGYRGLCFLGKRISWYRLPEPGRRALEASAY